MLVHCVANFAIMNILMCTVLVACALVAYASALPYPGETVTGDNREGSLLTADTKSEDETLVGAETARHGGRGWGGGWGHGGGGRGWGGGGGGWGGGGGGWGGWGGGGGGWGHRGHGGHGGHGGWGGGWGHGR
ncbi:uncharacterized protein LOC116771986 isoform X1 [Danaus plexippus]|uniref:uncharacterized protein LOC116771986 isoform X1 n=1 Tax=Danaus plexippus TaxID=13037 RepID=UPI002AB0E0F3|nr:uncharacterized protein LOC116771986 isoform X1 [Danaus plexippus]